MPQPLVGFRIKEFFQFVCACTVCYCATSAYLSFSDSIFFFSSYSSNAFLRCYLSSHTLLVKGREETISYTLVDSFMWRQIITADFAVGTNNQRMLEFFFLLWGKKYFCLNCIKYIFAFVYIINFFFSLTLFLKLKLKKNLFWFISRKNNNSSLWWKFPENISFSCIMFTSSFMISLNPSWLT